MTKRSALLASFSYILFTLCALPSCSQDSQDSQNSQNSQNNQNRPEQGQTIYEPQNSDEICPHPFMPLIKGATWSYLLGDPEKVHRTKAEISVLEITNRGKAQYAKIKRVVGRSDTIVEAVCTRKGVDILAFFIPLGPPLAANMNYAPSITKRVGALLLPLSKLRKNAEWDFDLEAHTENPGGKALTMDSLWSVEARVLGEKQITVKSGSYSTTQIRYRVTGHHRPPEEEDVVFSNRVMDPPAMTFTYSFAKGAGVVLIEGEPLETRPGVRPRWELVKVSKNIN